MLEKDAQVLIVDDHQAMRRTISDIMRLFGYQNLLYAEDGIMALKMLANNPEVRLVMLDWNMPRMTGYECLQKIRAEKTVEELPVLMVTAEAERNQIIAAVQAGANNYVVKPFPPDTLARKLKEIFPQKK